jgi:hypothetical protein
MFGLDLKSVIVGILFAYFALPFLINLISGAGKRGTGATA